jgi:hypothetical protein
MSKHKAKIAKIFEHPLSGNIDSKKVLSALEHFGAKIDLNKEHRAIIHLNGKEHSMTLSHRPELSKDAIVKLRHFLEEVGVTPDTI